MKALLVAFLFAPISAMQLKYSPNTGKSLNPEASFYTQLEIQSIINTSHRRLKLNLLDTPFDETSFVIPRKYVINVNTSEKPLLNIEKKIEILGEIIVPLTKETANTCNYSLASALLQIANVNKPNVPPLLLYVRKAVWPSIYQAIFEWGLYENPQSKPLLWKAQDLDWQTCKNTLLTLKISSADEHSNAELFRPYLIAAELSLLEPGINA